MSKTNPGRFFEDYRLGEVIRHAVPRTVSGGERALYHALYPARGALYSSDAFAQACGLPGSPLDDLIVFHTVFGKTVPDISLNAVANLGYAEGRWLKPVAAGETLSSESEVIGLRQNSNGKSGVVWVRTTGRDASGAPVLDYVRWVMVRKRDPGAYERNECHHLQRRAHVRYPLAHAERSVVEIDDQPVQPDRDCQLRDQAETRGEHLRKDAGEQHEDRRIPHGRIEPVEPGNPRSPAFAESIPHPCASSTASSSPTSSATSLPLAGSTSA